MQRPSRCTKCSVYDSVMAWEHRGNGTYYYTAERVGGRVVKRYVGAGYSAQMIAELERLARQERETKAGVERAVRESLDELDALLSPLNAIADAAIAAAMVAAGYHRHNRGSWRKRRG